MVRTPAKTAASRRNVRKAQLVKSLLPPRVRNRPRSPVSRMRRRAW